MVKKKHRQSHTLFHSSAEWIRKECGGKFHDPLIKDRASLHNSLNIEHVPNPLCAQTPGRHLSVRSAEDMDRIFLFPLTVFLPIHLKELQGESWEDKALSKIFSWAIRMVIKWPGFEQFWAIIWQNLMTTALVYQYMYHKTIQVLHKLPSTQPEPIRTAMTALSDPATAHPGVFSHHTQQCLSAKAIGRTIGNSKN